jgi:hypothetical protein
MFPEPASYDGGETVGWRRDKTECDRFAGVGQTRALQLDDLFLPAQFVVREAIDIRRRTGTGSVQLLGFDAPERVVCEFRLLTFEVELRGQSPDRAECEQESTNRGWDGYGAGTDKPVGNA